MKVVIKIPNFIWWRDNFSCKKKESY